MDELQKEVPEGEFECVSAEDLFDAHRAASNFHLAAFVILLYIRVHSPFWSRFVGYFRENKMCCFKSENLNILEGDDIITLENYSMQMRKTLKLIEEGNSELLVEDGADLLRVNESVSNS